MYFKEFDCSKLILTTKRQKRNANHPQKQVRHLYFSSSDASCILSMEACLAHPGVYLWFNRVEMF